MKIVGSLGKRSRFAFTPSWPVLGILLIHLWSGAGFAQTGPGYALSFDGVDDEARTPATFGALVPSTEITIEFWQRAVSPRIQSTFHLSPDQAANRINVHAPYQDGKVYWHFGNFPNGGALSYTPPDSILGTWQHFAFVASQSGNFMRIYRNGILETNKVGMTPFINGGNQLLLGGGAGDHFLGQIDEFRVWNVARTASQIATNIHRRLSMPQANLITFWRFDEGAGLTASDEGPNGLTATLTNGTAWVLSTAPVDTISTRPADNLTFNGARLNGVVLPQGLETVAWFEWGTTTNYDHLSLSQNLSGTNAVAITQFLNGLSVNQVYHFRAVAANSSGTVYGEDATFVPVFFVDSGVALPGVYRGAAAVADFDNDGLLDLLLTGSTNRHNVPISELWRNTGNGFARVSVSLPGVSQSAVAWGDYDNDGRMDFVLTGVNSTLNPIGQIWRNNVNGFSNINAGITGVYLGAVAWGDFDNDGRLDLFLTGLSLGSPVAELWRNSSTGFARVPIAVPGVYQSSVSLGDYDNDGRLDILLSGQTLDDSFVTQIWRNTGSGFADINAGFPGIAGGSAVWGDYNNDGRLDVLLAGNTGTADIVQVWRNTGSNFVNINAPFSVPHERAAWGDYDNDGRLDILLSTASPAAAAPEVWRNTTNGFSLASASLPVTSLGSAVWIDYNNDGRLDILTMGFLQDPTGFVQVARNTVLVQDNSPLPPTGLTVTPSTTMVTFGWNPASDPETPAAGLTYNLRVGTTPGGTEIVSPQSFASGQRRLPTKGNADHRLNATLKYEIGQTYYWSVQAVDTAFRASQFADEQHFTFGLVLVPTNGVPVPGDTNGDGAVDQNEFEAVVKKYFQQHPPAIEGVAGPTGTLFNFGLPNLSALNFSVIGATNVTAPLNQWEPVGPATLFYQFTDPAATNYPARFYQLLLQP